MASIPAAGTITKLSSLNALASLPDNAEKMPVLFLGHGNPMNAIEENEFVQGFRDIAKEIPKPVAILCVSAHWETRGTYVTAMELPRTIHDFGNFPPELYRQQYPAPGSPELAKETKKVITKTDVGLDESWGLDHGAWTVLKHLYPNADVPVIQMSIDYTKPAQYHYELAKELASLRSKGVMIVGSGNMVHNIPIADFSKIGANYGYDWAIEASEKMKSFMLNDQHSELIDYRRHGRAFQLAIPTPEHYLPLLYAIALKEEKEKITIFNDKPVGGSFTMTSIKISREK